MASIVSHEAVGGNALTLERKIGAVRAPGFIAKVRSFFLDSWTELQKVVWPSRRDVARFTVVVLFTICAVSFFLWLWDNILIVFTKPIFS